jgi:hypothetical protein
MRRQQQQVLQRLAAQAVILVMAAATAVRQQAWSISRVVVHRRLEFLGLGG